jgi:hypothetical protein
MKEIWQLRQQLARYLASLDGESKGLSPVFPVSDGAEAPGALDAKDVGAASGALMSLPPLSRDQVGAVVFVVDAS